MSGVVGDRSISPIATADSVESAEAIEAVDPVGFSAPSGGGATDDCVSVRSTKTSWARSTSLDRAGPDLGEQLVDVRRLAFLARLGAPVGLLGRFWRGTRCGGLFGRIG